MVSRSYGCPQRSCTYFNVTWTLARQATPPLWSTSRTTSTSPCRPRTWAAGEYSMGGHFRHSGRTRSAACGQGSPGCRVGSVVVVVVVVVVVEGAVVAGGE